MAVAAHSEEVLLDYQIPSSDLELSRLSLERKRDLLQTLCKKEESYFSLSSVACIIM